jgi:hypothetical protein
MKAHVEIPEGRWLPSRYRYAIFRAAAYLRLRLVRRTRPPVQGRRLVLMIDRDQNPFESFTLSLFAVLWSAACVTIAAAGRPAIPPLLAAGLFTILILVVPVIIQMALYVVSGVMALCRQAGLPVAATNHGAQTAVFFILMLAAAAAAAGSRLRALQFLGWIWIALLALNAAAAVLMRLLAGPVAAAEERLREAPSDF